DAAGRPPLRRPRERQPRPADRSRRAPRGGPWRVHRHHDALGRRRRGAAARPRRARRGPRRGPRAGEPHPPPPGAGGSGAARGGRRHLQGLDGGRQLRGLPTRLGGGAVMDTARIEATIGEEYRFLVQERAGWSLAAGPQDLELVAHALRVLLHTGTLGDFREEYRALAACQHADGGWAPRSDEPASTVWVSAFCALMQLRGNRILAEPALAASVRRAIDYFLATQEDDGRWVDPRWADLDTTSHPVSFFNVVLALGEGHRRAEVERAWRRGLAFILERQTADGGWYDADFHPSGVEITAHLIQDAVVADLVIDRRLGGAQESCAKGAAKLYEWQAQDGSWDGENVDHTMDCTRSLMVVARILNDSRAEEVIMRGLQWILTHKNEQGWGDFPGMETNLERTCDGLDTLLKYQTYRNAAS